MEGDVCVIIIIIIISSLLLVKQKTIKKDVVHKEKVKASKGEVAV